MVQIFIVAWDKFASWTKKAEADIMMTDCISFWKKRR